MKGEDIDRKGFSKRLRGYSPQEVDAFISQVGEFARGLESQLAQAQSELAEARTELKNQRARDHTLEAALNQAREMADEIKVNAERESQLLVAEAELQAEKILSQAHNRLAQIHDDIGELKRQRVQFEVRLRSLVEAHMKLLDVELDRDREMADLEDKIKILRSSASK